MKTSDGGAGSYEAAQSPVAVTAAMPEDGHDDSFQPGVVMRALVLLLLAEAPGHGYGLYERLGRLGVKPRHVTTVYRELRVLEEEGLISSFWEASQVRGPARRTYRLRRAGRRELDAVMPQLVSLADALDESLARYGELPPSRTRPPLRGSGAV